MGEINKHAKIHKFVEESHAFAQNDVRETFRMTEGDYVYRIDIRYAWRV